MLTCDQRIARAASIEFDLARINHESCVASRALEGSGDVDAELFHLIGLERSDSVRLVAIRKLLGRSSMQIATRE